MNKNIQNSNNTENFLKITRQERTRTRKRKIETEKRFGSSGSHFLISSYALLVFHASATKVYINKICLFDHVVLLFFHFTIPLELVSISFCFLVLDGSKNEKRYTSENTNQTILEKSESLLKTT